MKEIRHCDHVHTIRDRHDFTGTGNRHCGGDDPDCPHPTSEEQTEFQRRPMVDWLNPRQLAATGVKTVTASTFGGYADKREMEAVLTVADDDPGNPFDVDGDYSKKNELWFDYVADLGDGFDATYTMACLLARNLTIAEKDYPQGRFVILGGDQVYPTASREEYHNRFLGPYRAAYPWAPGSEPRHLYALPGNHDWYDGLTSFIRIFCQSKGKPGEGGRWIGGWRTQQRRSYFAIHLPHDWWIWGIDSQLASDIDRPQIEYFDQLARKMRRQMSDKEKEKLSREERLKVEKAENERGAKQKIILVTAEPNWVFSGDQAARDEGCAIDEEAFDTMSWFENRYIRRNCFQLRLVVAGDLHHYVRYEGPQTQRITSGGGGAYLLATHRMPKTIVLKEGTTQTFSADLQPVTYERKTCYPAREESERLAAGVFGLPARNKAFALFLACVYVLFSWAAMTSMRLTLLAGLAMIF